MNLQIVVDNVTSLDLDAGDELRCGRVADPRVGLLGLDPLDRGISRRAVKVRHRDAGWVVHNTSSYQPLYIDHPSAGPLTTLPPGCRHLVDGHTSAIEVRGRIRAHRIVFTQNELVTVCHVPSASITQRTVNGRPIVLTAAERVALVALFRGYLEDFPRRNCEPLTYRAAGDLLELPAVTVRRRTERVRARLRRSGVILEGPSAKYQLAAYLLDHRIIGPADLALVTSPGAIGSRLREF